MQDPQQTLIAPFKAVWLSLAAQMNAWSATIAAVSVTRHLERRVSQIQQDLTTILGEGKVPITVGLLLRDAGSASRKVELGLATGMEPLVYPLLTGTWSVVEAATEDLIGRILQNDPIATERALKHGKPSTLFEPGSDDYFRSLGTRLRSSLQRNRGSSVVESDTTLLAFFGAPMIFPDQKASAIEEINQARNVILHRQGVVDTVAARKAPRLAQYKGERLPASDPMFGVAGSLLHEYMFEWMQAVIHSPYLRAAMEGESRRPLPPGFEERHD
jgi:hypothetical protein